MSVDSLHDALRKRFKTSTDACIALGINPALLHERPNPMKRYAHDAARLRRVGGADEEDQLSVPDAMEQIRQILNSCIDGDSLAVAIVDELSQATGVGEPEPEAGSREAEDRRRRRAMGLDAAGPRHISASQQRGFNERVPSAARILFY